GRGGVRRRRRGRREGGPPWPRLRARRNRERPPALRPHACRGGAGTRGVTPRRVVVVGGGIAGLAAAHRLVEHARAGAALDVVLLEGSARLGGCLRTERYGRLLLQHRAGSVVTRKRWGVRPVRAGGPRDPARAPAP